MYVFAIFMCHRSDTIWRAFIEPLDRNVACGNMFVKVWRDVHRTLWLLQLVFSHIYSACLRGTMWPEFDSARESWSWSSWFSHIVPTGFLWVLRFSSLDLKRGTLRKPAKADEAFFSIHIIVNKAKWLGSPEKLFVIYVCSLFWPWPCTKPDKIQ